MFSIIWHIWPYGWLAVRPFSHFARFHRGTRALSVKVSPRSCDWSSLRDFASTCKWNKCYKILWKAITSILTKECETNECYPVLRFRFHKLRGYVTNCDHLTALLILFMLNTLWESQSTYQTDFNDNSTIERKFKKKITIATFSVSSQSFL